MFAYFASFALCLMFVEMLMRMAVFRDAMAVVTTSREAARVMASTELEDDAKEKLIRRAAMSIMMATVVLATKFIAILLVLFGLFWVVSSLSPTSGQELLAALTAPVPLVAMSVATVAYAWVRGRVIGRRRRNNR